MPRNQEQLGVCRSLLPLFISNEQAINSSLQAQWDRPIQIFPGLQKFEAATNWSQIIACFYALKLNAPTCFIVPPECLLLRWLPLTYFAKRTLELQIHKEYGLELIIEQASLWGYTRCSMVTEPGQLAKRGDIVDIFPTGYERPVRLEFFGDTLEEMRLFDAGSQRSLRNLDEMLLLPFLPSVSNQEKEEVVERLEELKVASRLSDDAAYSIKKTLETSPATLLPASLFAGCVPFEDWLTEDTVWFLPEEADALACLEEARLSWEKKSEADAIKVVQPTNLTLRPKNDIPPWQHSRRLNFANLTFADTLDGIDLQERKITSFETLFPEREAKDRPWQALMQGLKDWQNKYHQVILSFSTQRGRNKFVKLAEQDGVYANIGYDSKSQGLMALVSPFRGGVHLVWDKQLILGEDILFPRANKPTAVPKGKFHGLHTFEGIKEGDLLVHRDYGIGRYGGLHHLVVNKVGNDFLLLEYAGHDKLYVPADRLYLIQRYNSADGSEPCLDRLNGQGWRTSREKAKKAIEKIAADLVEMYAYRKVAKGFLYGPINEIYREFEATFGYEETPDQARAIQDVLDDKANPTPMDRLICGDVGFGKTEVAMRAAFRAASEGRQVALLCPTTVLAEQHYQTFRARFSGFPINVGLLSRFVSKTKQHQVLEAAAKGKMDILIGTHRLISSDVHLPNLGLLILDEEQRFGVRHKEKLKSLKKNVDVLTLTATPIPRTLQLSMSGIRDLSLIETAPENRKPVATELIKRSDALLSEIVTKELARKGQIFWVYNRVQGLEKVAEYVRKLVPGVKVGIAHGRLSESILEDTMYKFWHGEIDILVCTSIVESGLDFPNVNTIIIDQAQLFGLGQLYQLRGRVGRSDRQAFCYLLVNNEEGLGKISAERMRILQEMDYLGAGFHLAMEDLRLRGAGNILGEVQSGHMCRVGLDLYLEMLENTVARLKGQPEILQTETELNLGLSAHIPVSYMDDSRERMRFYKALTGASNSAERDEIVFEIRDRFGTLPEELRNFLAILHCKDLFNQMQVVRADINTDQLRITWAKGQTKVAAEDVIRLVHTLPGSKVVPPASVLLPLATDVPFEKALDQMRLCLQEILQPKT
ncbi:MAG: transcription-repair coupling factor [Desulfovibrio sp.]|nr:transcription-repair coupling factor [Desulfovibrio sp.]